MEEVVNAIVIMTGLGLFFASVLALAYRFLRVEEDPRLEVVEDLLPGNNCGACGEPGCAAFAGKLLEGAVTPGKCTVASEGTLEDLASFLGVDVGAEEKRIARLKCAGSMGQMRRLAAYEGLDSCRAAVLVAGGGRACSWGCIGLGDCELVCGFDAIVMSDGLLPVVDPELCSACNDCIEVCPLDLFVLVPESEQLFVQCNSPLSGEEATDRCKVACDACGRCALDAPEGTVEMVDGLPVVKYDQEAQPTRKATWRCPTGAIVWLEGKQFKQPKDSGQVPARRNRAKSG